MLRPRMLSTRTGLLAIFAVVTALPLAILAPGCNEPAWPHHAPAAALPEPQPRIPFRIDLPPSPSPAAPPGPSASAPDARDAEIVRLHAALAEADDEIESLCQQLRERDGLWKARLARSHLEDDLHELLHHEFPEIAELEDPWGDDTPVDEVVEVLLQVAEWLGPETVEVDGEERPGPRRIGLAELRAAVDDSAILRLARRLPYWNLQRALTPMPETWWSEPAGRGGSRLRVVGLSGGDVVTLQVLELEHEDPRVHSAHEATAATEERRARDLEMQLGLPRGALE